MILSSSAFAADPPAGKELADKAGVFTVTAGDGWTRQDKAETAALPLVLTATKFERGKVVPTFKVQASAGADKPLTQIAKGMVDQAKANEPDQSDVGKPTDVKLDGEKAVQVVIKVQTGGHKVQNKYVLASHKGKLYIVSLTCERGEYAARSGDADSLFESFKWK